MAKIKGSAGAGSLLLSLLIVWTSLDGTSVVHAQATATIRAVHIATGAAAVDISIGNQPSFSNVAFRAATPYAPVPAGRANVRVSPAGQPQQAVLDTTIDLGAGQPSTLVVTGETPNLSVLVLPDDNAPPPAGQAKVRFVHGAPDVPPVDVATGTGQVLFDGVGFRGAAGYVTVPAGTYALEMRPDNQTTTLFRVPSLTLSAGQIVTLFAAGKAADNSLAAVPVIYAAGTGASTLPAAGTGFGGDEPLSLYHLALATLLLAAGVAALGQRRLTSRRAR